MANKSTFQPTVYGSRASTHPNFITVSTWDAGGWQIGQGYHFMGYAPIDVGCVVVKFNLKTVDAWTTAPTNPQKELGLFTGPFNLGKQTVITRQAVVNLLPYVSAMPAVGGSPSNTVGPRNIVLTPPSVIPKGTGIWIGHNISVGSGGSGITYGSITQWNSNGRDTLMTGVYAAHPNYSSPIGSLSFNSAAAKTFAVGPGDGSYGGYYANTAYVVTYYGSRGV